MKKSLIPVKKIIKKINECQTEDQIEQCEVIVDNYIKSAKKSGLANVEDLKDRLQEELLQRQEALYLVKILHN